MTLNKSQSNTLKLLAILFMLIDHIGGIVYPHLEILRIVGRIAFPLFAYQLAIGFRHTRNPFQQLKYLFLFGLISQIPYMIGFGLTEISLNIFFTLFVGYALVLAIEKQRYGVGAVMVIVGSAIPLEYGIYGVLLPVMFHLLSSRPISQFLAFAFATTLYSLVLSPLQIFAVLAFVVLLVVKMTPGLNVSVSKWFFYGFYPAHIVVLFILFKWVG